VSIKRIYRRVSVKKICRESLRDRAIEKGGAGTSVGLDIGKEELVAVVRWPDATFDSPWSVKNPSEIVELIDFLKLLSQHCDSLTIGLESTGTYGEAVRYAMTAAQLEVHRISGKASSDYQEIFDGVPSQHDGKDAAIIAELTSFGKGTAWPYEARSEEDLEIAHQVRRLDAFRGQATQWAGRLEGMLALHWPEVTDLLGLNRTTLVKCLMQYGSPQRLLADPEAAANLGRWGRAGLSEAKIVAVLESARTTRGVPPGTSQRQWIQEVASELHQSTMEVKACEKRLATIAGAHGVMSPFVEAVGAVTLCVIWAMVGDPQKYASSGAFLKALGLNLKELSSGKRHGQLAITKRGPSLSRKYLYFWALRSVQRAPLRPWYESFQKVGKGTSNGRQTANRKMKGLVALMRKLSCSLWYARTHDEPFDYAKVFPGRPLEKRRRRRIKSV
jgi:transposase